MDECAVCQRRLHYEQNNPFLFHDTVFIKRSSKPESKPWKNSLISISKQNKELQIFKGIHHSSTVKHKFLITDFHQQLDTSQNTSFEIITPQEILSIRPAKDQINILQHALQHTKN